MRVVALRAPPAACQVKVRLLFGGGCSSNCAQTAELRPDLYYLYKGQLANELVNGAGPGARGACVDQIVRPRGGGGGGEGG